MTVKARWRNDFLNTVLAALHCGYFLPSVVALAGLFLLSVSIAEAADPWTGRWRGSLVVTSGPGAGRTLPCEFLISQTGTGLAGTVACPGFGPVPFSATGTAGVDGSASGGITFTGTRVGRTAGGNWSFPSRRNAGTWSISLAGH